MPWVNNFSKLNLRFLSKQTSAFGERLRCNVPQTLKLSTWGRRCCSLNDDDWIESPDWLVESSKKSDWVSFEVSTLIIYWPPIGWEFDLKLYLLLGQNNFFYFAFWFEQIRHKNIMKLLNNTTLYNFLICLRSNRTAWKLLHIFWL